MTYDAHANFAYGKITVVPSPVTTGLSLSVSNADAALLPDPATAGQYNMVVWAANQMPLSTNAEIVRVLAKGAADSGGTGNTQFTIHRQQEASAVRSIQVGDQIANNISAKLLTDIETNKLERSGDYMTGYLGIGTGAVPTNQMFAIKGLSDTSVTGTVAVTNNSAIVTGTGTSFSSQVMVGDAIQIAGTIFQVQSVASNTSLTLTANYTGTTASGLVITRDKDFFSLNTSFGTQQMYWTRGVIGSLGFPNALYIHASVRSYGDFVIGNNQNIYIDNENTIGKSDFAFKCGTDGTFIVDQPQGGSSLRFKTGGNAGATYWDVADSSFNSLFKVLDNGQIINKTITNSTTAYQMFESGNSLVFDIDSTNKRVGIGTTPGASLHITGNQSSTSWTTAGLGIRLSAQTYTDTGVAGTRTTAVVSSFAQPTLAGTNLVTISDSATVYIAGAPVAGTNMTLTRKYSLWVAANDSRFDGNVSIGNGNAQAVVAFDLNGQALFRGKNSNTTATPIAGVELAVGRDASGAATSGQTTFDVAFEWSGGGGGYRHWISSHHDGTVSSNGNALLFYVNNSATSQGSSNVGVGNVLALGLFGTGRVGIGTSSPSNILSITGQSAQTIWCERNTTANTAGNSLTIQSSGATVGATDKAGGDLILTPGVSTGLGRSLLRVQNFTPATATATADNTAVDREIFGALKVLTNNSAINIVNLTAASNTSVGAIIHYTAEVFNGTDLQVETGEVAVNCQNKAGVFSNNLVTKYGNQQAVTSGTLAVTFAVSAANPAVVSVNANSSLTPSAGYPRITYNIENLTQQAIAIQ